MNKSVFYMQVVMLACLASVFFLVPAMSESEKEAAADERCSACHADTVKAFARNPHAATEGGCTSCHVTAEEHLKNPSKETMFAFEDTELAQKKTEVCQTCHGATHPKYATSPHAQAGLDCSSCHDTHSGDRTNSLLPGGSATDTCQECHTDIFSQFGLNERHKLKEGILGCESCHNPHESLNTTKLGGFKDETCFECHADKQGPFVFEHGSVQIEGCTACHEPHGSVNRHMLTFQRSANLCFSCHVAVPSFHSRFTVDSNCSNCHATIHGSNLSPYFLE